MPYQTMIVEAEPYLEHNGVIIYHVYKNDDIDDTIRTYCFVTDPYHGENEDFDIRDAGIAPDFILDQIKKNDIEAWIKLALKAAIDQGLITQDGASWLAY
jgi:hypothetical protein